MIANNSDRAETNAVELFNKDFDNNSGSAAGFESAGLNVFYNSAATRYSSPTSEMCISTLAGIDGTPGYVKTGTISRNRELHLLNDLLSIDRNKYPKLELSFYVGHQQNSLLNRPIIQIGGNLYTYHNSTAQVNAGVVADSDFQANAEIITFLIDETTKDNWELLSFEEGETLARNTTPISLPDGLIERAGIYISANNTTVNKARWDKLRIIAKDVALAPTPLAMPIAYQSEPVVVEETPSSVTATWTARMSKPATTNTPVRMQFTGAAITEAYATILAGSYTANIQTIHAKGPAAFEVTGQVTPGSGYLTGANTVQKITVSPIMNLPEIRLKAWSDTDDMLLVEAVPELELVEWNDTTDTLKVKRKL